MIFMAACVEAADHSNRGMGVVNVCGSLAELGRARQPAIERCGLDGLASLRAARASVSREMLVHRDGLVIRPGEHASFAGAPRHVEAIADIFLPPPS